MSIRVDENTRLVVQGITGRDGSFHTSQMIEYGTSVVAGVTPGKGGQKFEGKVRAAQWDPEVLDLDNSPDPQLHITRPQWMC